MKDINIGATKVAYVCNECEGEGHQRFENYVDPDPCYKCYGIGYLSTEAGDELIKFIQLFLHP